MSEENKREIVIPGEVIAKGEDLLPGEGTYRENEEIISEKFGLADKTDKFVKVIPLSGVYMARKGNIVIGKVIDITFNGWIIEITAPYLAFLPVSECPRFVNKNDITGFMDIGDMVIARVSSAKHRGIDLSIKGRGLGKIEQGMILEINSNKVPRVIGKEGSMINIIKKESDCNIVVGQNGIIWIKGKTVKDELFAKEAILFVTEKSFINGLTDKIKEFFEEKKKNNKEKNEKFKNKNKNQISIR